VRPATLTNSASASPSGLNAAPTTSLNTSTSYLDPAYEHEVGSLGGSGTKEEAPIILCLIMCFKPPLLDHSIDIELIVSRVRGHGHRLSRLLRLLTVRGAHTRRTPEQIELMVRVTCSQRRSERTRKKTAHTAADRENEKGRRHLENEKRKKRPRERDLGLPATPEHRIHQRQGRRQSRRGRGASLAQIEV
jgi:hypothetical protein